MNCIRNYPWYRRWHEDYANRGLTIIGVHTPETATEKQIDEVRKRVREAKFQFPVVVDNQRQNWERWGNSMWPSVYLIDKRGYIRYWWYGELNWKGGDGETRMRAHLEALLAEDP
ncbi:MAG TPA: hypothetical protein DCY79_24590 [Planctomycetaceae bacterium]|nr:hypothetical protein [Blastopirellula sp.]HAY82999.1 hypothetical protein [Planctomycetaceae bacterium]